ncbi:MAG: hypothetical protein JWP97_1803 [Labilithrix sp.]|nr:hypothetical protein [Labilithrix sp.]
MATDNTPPRLRLIVTIAVIVVITLVSLDFVFKGYYAYMTDEARAEKTAPKTALIEQNKDELASLAGAKLPLDQAMAQVAKGTRDGLIEPKPSEDLGPMTGWSKLPKQVPLANPQNGPTPSVANDVNPATGLNVDGGAQATDGGALQASDGGQSPSTPIGPAHPNLTDAGPHPPIPAQDAGQHSGK